MLLLSTSSWAGPPADGGSASQASPRGVFGILPVGTFAVEIYDMVGSPRLTELTARWAAAIRQDPKYWGDFVKRRAAPGQALPYDPHFGLSRDEYAEMLLLMDRTRLSIVDRAYVTVKPEGNGRFSLNGGTRLPGLNGIVIDTRDLAIATPFGELTEHQKMDASANQKFIHWRGSRWQFENGDAESMTGTSVRLCLGRVTDSPPGRGIFYYKATSAKEGKLLGSATYILVFKLPITSPKSSR